MKGSFILVEGVEGSEAGGYQGGELFNAYSTDLIEVEAVDLTGQLADVIDAMENFILEVEIIVDLAELFLQVSVVPLEAEVFSDEIVGDLLGGAVGLQA